VIRLGGDANAHRTVFEEHSPLTRNSLRGNTRLLQNLRIFFKRTTQPRDLRRALGGIYDLGWTRGHWSVGELVACRRLLNVFDDELNAHLSTCKATFDSRMMRFTHITYEMRSA